MVRSLMNERGFAGCILNDVLLRLEERYEASFLVENTKKRCRRYVFGLEQVSRERQQPVKQSDFARPLLEFLDENSNFEPQFLLQYILYSANRFAQKGEMPTLVLED